ncbi:MAG: hypothetical protein LBQ89_07825 [Treponema sp.]|jgi:hypothetical protein|nr:hypothetical protein [Treponema sp.]
MAKQETIKNTFEGTAALDVYDRKYLKYFMADYTDRASISIYNALKTKDIAVIEDKLKDVANTASNFLVMVGLTCHIIEHERLYENTEFGVSYLRYADHLFDELNIPASTLSTAKTIVENYITYYKPLTKAGFKMLRNSNKLLYLPEALENHNEEEVYNRIVNDTYKNFRDWAQRKNIARNHKPGPDLRVEAEIKGNQLFINGKDVLNFPRGLSKDIKETIKNDLQKTFSIREGGNLPFIIDTYGRGEQNAIEGFLKKYRAKK